MACGCCHSCCGCGCGSSWNSGCGCGCDWDSGITTLPSFPDTAVSPSYRFPVYVSYPSFYAGAADIAAANDALFTVSGSGSSNGCGCGR